MPSNLTSLNPLFCLNLGFSTLPSQAPLPSPQIFAQGVSSPALPSASHPQLVAEPLHHKLGGFPSPALLLPTTSGWCVLYSLLLPDTHLSCPLGLDGLPQVFSCWLPVCHFLSNIRTTTSGSPRRHLEPVAPSPPGLQRRPPETPPRPC